MTGLDTLPRLLQRNARSFGDQTAMREKRHGIWQAATWAEHAAATLTFARGLAALGFAPGDRLAVLGDNRPPLYRAQLAAMCLGGVAVPCWPDASPEWLAHALGDAGVSIAVAEDEDQVDKLISIKDRLPLLRLIVFTDPRGVHRESLDFVSSIASVVQAGSTHPDIAAAIDKGAPDDLALICYVAQPDGAAQGVQLTHGNAIAAANAVAAAEDVRRTDEYFSYLPMAWIGEALYGMALPLLAGFACSCPEDPETARRDLRELGPTILLAPPPIWESLLGEIEIKAAHATPLKRRICARFLPNPYLDTPPSAGGSGFLGEWLVNAPIRDQLGLGRVRWAHTGGLPLAPHVLAFFTGLGVALRDGFGPAECAGLVALRGAAANGVTVRVSASGELEMRGANISAAALDAEGWWRSGHAGALSSDNSLTLTGQIADAGRLADGTEFAPHVVETALRGGRFVADVVAIGHGRAFVAALVAIDAAAVGDWAQSRSLTFTGTGDLVTLPEVQTLIREEIARSNARLPAAVRVQRYRFMDSPPGAASAEARLSPVLRRRLTLTHYAAGIEALFAGAEHPSIETVGEPRATLREEAA